MATGSPSMAFLQTYDPGGQSSTTNNSANRPSYHLRWIPWNILRQNQDFEFWLRFLNALTFPAPAPVADVVTLETAQQAVRKILDKIARDSIGVPLNWNPGTGVSIVLEVRLEHPGLPSAAIRSTGLCIPSSVMARYTDANTGKPLPNLRQDSFPSFYDNHRPPIRVAGDAHSDGRTREETDQFTCILMDIREQMKSQQEELRLLRSSQESAPRRTNQSMGHINSYDPVCHTERIRESDRSAPALEQIPPPDQLRRSHARSLSDLTAGDDTRVPIGDVPKFDLPPYTGEDNSLDLDQWLSEYRLCMAAYGWESDARLIRGLPLYLKGATRLWFAMYIQQRPDRSRLTWDKVVDDLKGNFQPEDVTMRYAQFMACHLKPQQSMLAYANELERLLRRAVPDMDAQQLNRTLVTTFMQNVGSKMQLELTRQFMIGKPFPSFSQMKTYASLFEATEMRLADRDTRNGHHQLATLAPANFVEQGRQDHSYENSLPTFGYQGQTVPFQAMKSQQNYSYSGNRDRVHQSPRSYQQENYQYDRYLPTPVNRDFPQRQSQSYRTPERRDVWPQQSTLQPDPVTHFTYDLAQEPTPLPPSVPATCDTCGEYGHLWRRCPNDGRLVPCSVPGCGRRFGHYDRRCPLLRDIDRQRVWEAARQLSINEENRERLRQQVEEQNTKVFELMSPSNPRPRGLSPTPDGGREVRQYQPQINRIMPRLEECSDQEEQVTCTDAQNSGSQPSESPKIVIGVDGQRVPVVIDTGAQVTVVSSHFYGKIHPEWDCTCSDPSPLLLYAFDATEPSNVLGTKSVELTFGPVTITHQIPVVHDPDGNFTMLIGQDINKRYQQTLCSKDSFVRYHAGVLAGISIPLAPDSPPEHPSEQFGQALASVKAASLMVSEDQPTVLYVPPGDAPGSALISTGTAIRPGEVVSEVPSQDTVSIPDAGSMPLPPISTQEEFSSSSETSTVQNRFSLNTNSNIRPTDDSAVLGEVVDGSTTDRQSISMDLCATATLAPYPGPSPEVTITSSTSTDGAESLDSLEFDSGDSLVTTHFDIQANNDQQDMPTQKDHVPVANSQAHDAMSGSSADTIVVQPQISYGPLLEATSTVSTAIQLDRDVLKPSGLVASLASINVNVSGTATPSTTSTQRRVSQFPGITSASDDIIPRSFKTRKRHSAKTKHRRPPKDKTGERYPQAPVPLRQRRRGRLKTQAGIVAFSVDRHVPEKVVGAPYGRLKHHAAMIVTDKDVPIEGDTKPPDLPIIPVKVTMLELIQAYTFLPPHPLWIYSKYHDRFATKTKMKAALESADAIIKMKKVTYVDGSIQSSVSSDLIYFSA